MNPRKGACLLRLELCTITCLEMFRAADSADLCTTVRSRLQEIKISWLVLQRESLIYFVSTWHTWTCWPTALPGAILGKHLFAIFFLSLCLLFFCSSGYTQDKLFEPLSEWVRVNEWLQPRLVSGCWVYVWSFATLATPGIVARLVVAIISLFIKFNVLFTELI